MSELTFFSAVAMAERIRKKDISPAELVEAHLAKIERLDPKLNAFVHVDSARARRAARRLPCPIEKPRAARSARCTASPSASRVRWKLPVCAANREPGCAPDSSLRKMRRSSLA